MTDEFSRATGAARALSVPVWLARPFASYAATFMGGTRLRVSNAKVKRELRWAPGFPTYREGLADVGATLTGRTSGR
ncbi:MAG TPA: hypothetical protein VG709_03080 [Actinomycetota bacterium]|nr:hypothetical protein [Actinomycetota bacterium]